MRSADGVATWLIPTHGLPRRVRYCPGVGIHLKQQRERNFPINVAKVGQVMAGETRHFPSDFLDDSHGEFHVNICKSYIDPYKIYKSRGDFGVRSGPKLEFSIP